MADRGRASDDELLDLIGADFHDDPDVEVGTMFHNPGLKVGGKLFAFTTNEGELIVKLPRKRADELADAGEAAHVVMGKRTMREWITVPGQSDRDATLARWRELAREAHDYVDSLRRAT